MATDSTRVKDIIRFIEALTVPSGKGEGQPVVLRPFQREFIRAIYGPVDRHGKRIVRRAILSLARKNGKSLLTAALALTHLVGPERIRNGEIYSAANAREQAGVVFRYAKQMIEAEPELLQGVKIVDSLKRMVAFSTASIYRAISAEAGIQYGLNPSVVIYDELSQTKSRELFDALDTSMAAREEPLMLIISTQSNDPQHILSQLIDDGLQGYDPTTICHLYAAPDDAEEVFTSRKVWKLANPALGDFRSLSEMRTAAKRAVRMPTFEAPFRNLYLNQRCNSESPLIPRLQWEACQNGTGIEPGAEVYLGLDLSAKTDLTALVAVTAGEEDRVKAWFWKPGETLDEHEKRDRVPYALWKRQGIIETTPGRAMEYAWVAERLGRIVQEYRVLGLAFDRWRVDDLLNAMGHAGLDCYVEDKDDARAGALRMVNWGQGYASMTQAVEALEVSVLNRTFKHDGNPCLTWNFANAVAIQDAAGNKKLDKSKTRFRIDGAVACAMALGLKSKDRKELPGPSIYEQEMIKVF